MSAHHAIIIDIKRANPDFAGPPDDEWVDDESFIAQLNRRESKATDADWAEVIAWVDDLFDLLDGSDYTDGQPAPANGSGLVWHHPMYEVTAREATLYDVPVPDAPGT